MLLYVLVKLKVIILLVLVMVKMLEIILNIGVYILNGAHKCFAFYYNVLVCIP